MRDRLGRRKRLITLLCIGGTFTIAVALLLSRTLSVYGYWTHFDPQRPGPCRPVSGVAGPEDMQFDPVTHSVYIASLSRPARRAEPAPGGLFVIDANRGATSLRRLSTTGIGDIQPHGLSLFRDRDGSLTLATINQRDRGHVEVLLFGVEVAPDGTPRSLRLRARVANRDFTTPNDIALVSPSRFYVTNDRGARGTASKLIERYLAAPWSNVVYWDGSQARIVARHIAFANGVYADTTSTRVFVSETLGRRLLVYRRSPSDGSLHRVRAIGLGFNPDNLSVTRQGIVLVTGHQSFIKLNAYATNRKKRSPSVVVAVSVRGPKPTKTVIYADSGSELSASSVAVLADSSLFIGDIYDDDALVCRVSNTGVRRALGI